MKLSTIILLPAAALSLMLVGCGGASNGAGSGIGTESDSGSGSGAGGDSTTPEFVNGLPTQFSATKLNLQSGSLFTAKGAQSYVTSSNNSMLAMQQVEKKPKLHQYNKEKKKIEEVVFSDEDGNEFQDIEVTDIDPLGEDFAKIDIKFKKKVAICHIPPGNPENARTITVAEPSFLTW